MKQAVGGVAVEIEICLQIFFSPAISEFKRFLWLYLGRKCKCTVKTGRESGQIKKDVKPQVGKKVKISFFMIFFSTEETPWGASGIICMSRHSVTKETLHSKHALKTKLLSLSD